MPNHVHVLLTPLPGEPLGEILRDHKGFTSRTINKALSRSGQLWQEDFYDRFIRDQAHHERVGAYIEWNPVKAGLCDDPSVWQYSSANEDAYERLLRIERERGEQP
jgi:REP element-mobilizing transposase RayT